MTCMTIRTLSESIQSQDDQRKVREEAKLRRIVRYCSQKHKEYECSEDGKAVQSSGTLNVSFGGVHIKNYYVILGDNPGGKSGPPLSLSWITGVPQESISLDEYENNRVPRRTGMSLILASDYRIKLLTDLGYTEMQIKSVVKEMSTIRAQRRDTYAAMVFGDGWSTAVESIKKLLHRGKNHHKVKNYEEIQLHPSWISE